MCRNQLQQPNLYNIPHRILSSLVVNKCFHQKQVLFSHTLQTQLQKLWPNEAWMLLSHWHQHTYSNNPIHHPSLLSDNILGNILQINFFSCINFFFFCIFVLTSSQWTWIWWLKHWRGSLNVFVLMATIKVFLTNGLSYMSIEDHGWMELCPLIFFLG